MSLTEHAPVQAALTFVCPDCEQDMTDARSCAACGATFGSEDGIPILLPSRTTPVIRAYRQNYDRIAADDLEAPIVADRWESLHKDLVRFIGNTSWLRVLDIGCAAGSYLQVLDCAEAVGVDLALAYLRTIDPVLVTRICGDVERLPVRLDYFDVLILSDVLEHLLDTEPLLRRMRDEVREDARVIVHIPWEEDISKYDTSPYPFVHLRSFDDDVIDTMFEGFTALRKERFCVGTIPFAMFEFARRRESRPSRLR